MIFSDTYNDVTSSFNSLWNFKERQNTLEIITPFATTSQNFVSVFLTQRENEFIVSDGGWLDQRLYDNNFDRRIDCYEKIFSYYSDNFKIQEAKNQSGTSVFYKKTKNKIAIPSLILDVSNFVSAMISLSHVEYGDKEIENEQNFRVKAKNFLSKIVPLKKLHIDDYLDSKKEIRVNAIIEKKNSKVILINFITGSNYHYFRTNITKTNFVFELAQNSKESALIESKVALIDNKSHGYVHEKISRYLNHLIQNTNSQKVNWTNKIDIKKAVAQKRA